MAILEVDQTVEVFVNIAPLVVTTDFYTTKEDVAYNQSGMDLNWNFITTAGVVSQTNVTPTTAGDYDWAHVGNAMYKIEIPASGGASINNDTEGTGWFSGVCTGVLPWISERYTFVKANVADSLINGTDYLETDALQIEGVDATNQINAECDTALSDYGANTTTPPTVAAIRSEMDTNSTQLAAIVGDTNELQTDWANGGRLDLILDARASQSSVDTVDSNVDAILLDTGTDGVIVATNNDKTGYALSAAGIQAIWDALTSALTTAGSIGKLLVDNINATMSSRSTFDNTSDKVILTDATEAQIDAIETDTNEIQGKLPTNNIMGSSDTADHDTDIDAILVDTGTTLPAQISGLNDISTAQVNAEMVDVLTTDTYAEPGSVPAATSSLKDKLNWLFVLARNKMTQTSTTTTLRNDADGANIATSTISDDGTTFTRGEWS